MDVLTEIRELEAQGVFIHLSYDHYTTGTNCNWSIEFIKKQDQTMWYGDNHEFGDTADAIVAAVKFAKWLLQDEERMTWFFYNAKETVTDEGHANWMKMQDMRRMAHEFLAHQTEKGI